jgi:hypothetical protein
VAAKAVGNAEQQEGGRIQDTGRNGWAQSGVSQLKCIGLRERTGLLCKKRKTLVTCSLRVCGHRAKKTLIPVSKLRAN